MVSETRDRRYVSMDCCCHWERCCVKAGFSWVANDAAQIDLGYIVVSERIARWVDACEHTRVMTKPGMSNRW